MSSVLMYEKVCLLKYQDRKMHCAELQISHLPLSFPAALLEIREATLRDNFLGVCNSLQV